MEQSGRRPALRPWRWLLVPWLVLVYTWGIGTWDLAAVARALWGDHLSTHVYTAVSPDMGMWVVGDVVQTYRLFTGLMLLHGLLYGLSLLVPPRGRWQVVYAAAQGLVVLTIGLVLTSESATLDADVSNVILGLYLALAIDAVALLKRPRPVLLAVSGYVALFLLTYVNPWDMQVSRAMSPDRILDPAVFLFVAGVGSFVVLYIQRAQAHERSQALLHDLEGAHAQLAASAARIEELTLLAERRRLARELHDTVTQGLAGVIMQLEAADGRLADHHPARAREIVQQAMVRARAAFTAARCAIEGLRDEAIAPADLVSAAQEEIARFGVATGIVCESELAGLAQLPGALHDPILRVIGEGLMNVARHAGPCHAWIRAARLDRGLEVEVRDDGVGFDPSTMAARGHYGLVGLRERARLVGSVLEVTSTPGQGTALRLVLPGVALADEMAHTAGARSPAACPCAPR